MKRKKTSKVSVAVIVFISFVGFSFQKEADNNKIIWNENYLLKWAYFTGKPLNNNPHSAVSDVGLDSYFEYKSKECSLEVEIKSCFTKSKSWVKADKKTNHLLQHEQLHFDIAELYARKFKKALKESKFKKNNIKEKFNNISVEISNELTNYHKLYDKETNHHINEGKQSEWNEKVTQQLNDLQEYKETHLKIKVK